MVDTSVASAGRWPPSELSRNEAGDEPGSSRGRDSLHGEDHGDPNLSTPLNPLRLRPGAEEVVLK